MLLLKDKRQLTNTAAIIALACILLWPAFVNGEPFYMTDTSSYVRGADAAAHWLTGHRTVWTGEFFQRFGSAGEATKSASAVGDPPVVLAGRSIYYGILLYLGQFFGNFWAVAAVQALLVSTSISVTMNVFRGGLIGKVAPESTAGKTLLFGGLLAAFTPVGYFVSYLMPDIFGALGLLAFAHLVILWQQNSRTSRAFWFVLLLAAMLFHTANFLLIGLMSALAAAALLLKMPVVKAGFAAVVMALAFATIGQALFSWSVKHATGASPIRPPFVAARIIDDGPGYDYLRNHCPQVKLIFCRTISFKARISDSLLWSKDPHRGIFQALSPSEQRRASAEQTRFVLAVLADRPLQTVKSSIGAVLRQAGHLDLESFNYTAQNIDYFNEKLPPPFIDQARSSKAFKDSMPVRFVEWATVTTVLLSLLMICWTIVVDIRTIRTPSPETAWLLTLILGVALNAVICGALSTPKGRYEMRLIWVLPFAALAVQPRRGGAPIAPWLVKRRAAA